MPPRDPRDPFSPSQTVAVGLAVVSPASSVFAVLAPIAVLGGRSSVLWFGLATTVGALVAFTYIVNAQSATGAPAAPHWVARALGPAWGSGLGFVSVVSLLVACAILLQALTHLLDAGLWWQTALTGGLLVAVASLGVRRTVWLIVLGLIVELVSLAVVSWVALTSSDTSPTAGASHGSPTIGAVSLASIPTILFALNGYGQSAYLVGDARDRRVHVRRVVTGTFLLAVLVEGIPFVALSRIQVPDSVASAGFPLVAMLDAAHTVPLVETVVRIGIGFALANALVSILHVGCRLLAPLSPRESTRPGSRATDPESRVADSPVMRRRAVLLGTAMIALAFVPPATLTIAAGENLVAVYLVLAVAAVRVTPRWRRAVAAVQAALMAALLLHGAATDTPQLAVTVSVFGLGVGVELLRRTRTP